MRMLALMSRSNSLTHGLSSEDLAATVLTVQRDNANDETNAQHHDDERVNLKSGALIGVELEHSRAAAAGASSASA